MIGVQKGRAYDLLQSLCGTETSGTRADDKDIDVTTDWG